MYPIAVAALLVLIAGCLAPYVVNRKKKRYEAEDLETLDRMLFLDAFTQGWDRAIEASEIVNNQRPVIFEPKK